jgi:holo-[acyl-carrier protein] synthase
MALAGVGVDMLEIGRVERAIARHPSFVVRVFTQDEREYCESCIHPASHYAACFAARRAVFKALGCQPASGIHIQDVSVAHSKKSRYPQVVLNGRPAEIARDQGVQEIALSLSYTHDVAVANAVAVTQEARPRQNGKVDSKEELSKTFRRARDVLDELEHYQNAERTSLAGFLSTSTALRSPGLSDDSIKE